MSRSVDPGHFFQTETTLDKSKRKTLKSKNTNGDPIKLTSKILAIVSDPADAARVYIAESTGIVRRVAIETGDKSTIYRGPTAPLTSVAVISKTIYAGCWDKTIWSWDISSREPQRRFVGHGDFVKALVCVRLGDRNLLISGGADATIIVWDLATGTKLHTLKGHTRGVQDLAIDPASISLPESDNHAENVKRSEVVIVSAGSDREIRRWRIAVVAPKTTGRQEESSIVEAAEVTDSSPLIRHETSVYKLYFDADDDLWTASADNTAKCLSRQRAWEEDTVLTHSDFVRDVVIDEEGGWAITACRDEEIRVWDRSSGKLYHTFSGHFEEVTGLAIIQARSGHKTLVSVSIDATLRKWSLDPKDVQAAKLKVESIPTEQEQQENSTSTGPGASTNPQAPNGTNAKNAAAASMLTEDEERELAELMDDDDVDE